MLASSHEAFIARIYRFKALVMVRSIIAASSIITLQILSLSPVLACDPYLYSGDFEEMLNDGESWEMVLDVMKNLLDTQVSLTSMNLKSMRRRISQSFPIFFDGI